MASSLRNEVGSTAKWADISDDEMTQSPSECDMSTDCWSDTDDEFFFPSAKCLSLPAWPSSRQVVSSAFAKTSSAPAPTTLCIDGLIQQPKQFLQSEHSFFRQESPVADDEAEVPQINKVAKIVQNKVTKIAEALDEVDRFEAARVVRVDGLRVMGDEGMSMFRSLLEKDFGIVEHVIEVVRSTGSGDKPGGFGFLVMSSAQVAEEVIAHASLEVQPGCEVKVRGFTPSEQRQESTPPMMSSAPRVSKVSPRKRGSRGGASRGSGRKSQ